MVATFVLFNGYVEVRGPRSVGTGPALRPGRDVRVAVLGPVHAVVDGQPVDLGSPKQRVVLAVLLSAEGGPVSVDRMVDLVWPTDPPVRARHSVQQYVSRLRAVLEPGRRPGCAPTVLRSEPAGYSLALDADLIDVLCFIRDDAAGRDALRAGNATVAVECWRRALTHWRGPAFADLMGEPFAAAEAARLDELRLFTIESRIAAELELGHGADLVPELHELVRAHPLREALWGQLMVCLYRAGRRADALRAYQRVRGILAEQLGLDPGPGLQELEGAVLAGSLATPTSIGSVATVSALSTPQPVRPTAGGPAAERSLIRGERRMAVVVSAALTDLEPLRSATDDRTVELLIDEARRRATAAITELAGSVVDPASADVLGAFGVPAAAENDPARAVRCALRLAVELGELSADVAGSWSVPAPSPRIAVCSVEVERGSDEPLPSRVGRRCAELGAAGPPGAAVVADDVRQLIEPLFLWGARVPDWAASVAVSSRAEERSLASRPAEPPYAASSPRLDNELGVPATRLIGREDVTATVLDALGQMRLVTLTGPGGVGKTRLAAHVAGQARGCFTDGIAACSLAPVRDPTAVPAALATALDVRQRQHRTVEESLVEVLESKQVLLVLDNCEHVIDVAAQLVLLLLRRCPRLTVLATSRERLGLIGERLIDVPPLPVPQSGSPMVAGSAVELFRERAGAAGVDIARDAEVIEVVGEICRRLDGLPLAIELAAAHVRALHPHDIVERLASSPSLVRSRFRDLADRHRSLQAVTDWSYELLTEQERELFDGLSVFAGSFDLQTAEHVAAAAGLAAEKLSDLLGALVDKSMLVVRHGRGPTRYVLLETLRSYGRERLVVRGAERPWCHAHARHYLQVMEQAMKELSGPDEPQWIRRLGQDMDNLREARRWSLDHDLDTAVRMVAALSWLRCRTMQAELELWAEETAERAGDHPLSPFLLGSAAQGAWSRGELIRARRLAQTAIAATAGPEQRLAREAMGAICLVEGSLGDALHHLEHATALARQAGDRYHEAWCLGGQAIVLSYLQRVAEAAQRFQQAEAIAHELGCPSLLAAVLYGRGQGLIETEPERALTLLDRSEALAREVGHDYIRTAAGISATTVRARRGDPVEVFPRFRELVQHLDRIGNRTQLWTMLRTLVCVFAKQGHCEPAAVLHAALDASVTAVNPYGLDHERLVEAARTITEKAGARQVEAWKEQGRTMNDQQAIAYTLAAIDHACESDRSRRSVPSDPSGWEG